jgi:hypothetical protein
MCGSIVTAAAMGSADTQPKMLNSTCESRSTLYEMTHLRL